MTAQRDAILEQPQTQAAGQAADPDSGAANHAPASKSAPTAKSGRYTADDLLELSQDNTHRYELIKGELKKMAPAGFEHGDVAMALGSRMRVFADDSDLGIVCAAETGFRLTTTPDTVRAPDIGFIVAERIADNEIPKRYFDGAPDLAVEIVSPHDSAAGVQEKVQSWLTHGTRLVWVVEPRTQTVSIYRPDGSAQVLQRDAELDGEDVLPGFGFQLERLFRTAKSTAKPTAKPETQSDTPAATE